MSCRAPSSRTRSARPAPRSWTPSTSSTHPRRPGTAIAARRLRAQEHHRRRRRRRRQPVAREEAEMVVAAEAAKAASHRGSCQGRTCHCTFDMSTTLFFFQECRRVGDTCSPSRTAWRWRCNSPSSCHTRRNRSSCSSRRRRRHHPGCRAYQVSLVSRPAVPHLLRRGRRCRRRCERTATSL